MGSRLSKPGHDSSSSLLPAGKYNHNSAAKPFQDDIPLNSLFAQRTLLKSGASASTVPVDRVRESGEIVYTSFPTELPERPVPARPKGLSFTRRKPSQLPLAACPNSSLSTWCPESPHFSPSCLCEGQGVGSRRPHPYATSFSSSSPPPPSSSSNYTPTFLTPPTSPSPPSSTLATSVDGYFVSRKPVGKAPALETPNRTPHHSEIHVPEIDVLGDILAKRIATLKLDMAHSTPPRRSKIAKAHPHDDEFLRSIEGGAAMAGPRRSRRLIKDEHSTLPTERLARKRAPQRAFSSSASLLSPSSYSDIDSDSPNARPRKIRNRNLYAPSEIGRVSLERQIDDTLYPDLSVRGALAESSHSQDLPKGTQTSSNSVNESGYPGPSVPTSADDDDLSLAEELQEVENEALSEEALLDKESRDNEMLGTICRVERRIPRSVAQPNHDFSNNGLRNNNITVASLHSTDQGTQTNPIPISSDSDWESVSDDETQDDADVARRLERESFERLALAGLDRKQQEEADAAMAQQLYEEQEEEERKEREIRNRRRDCVVCRDSFLPGEFASLVDCLHQPEVCTECFAQWISSEIKDGSWREIKCPGTDCGLALKYHEVQQLATPESFAELDNLLFRDALGGDDNFRWCRAEGCQSGQVHESGHAGNIFRCVGCGFRVCVIHDKTWHEGETCDEYDYRISGEKEKDEQKKLQVEQEQASCEAIGKLSKKCPGIKCAWNIQKNDGCDHMTCSRCRHEFCWVCLAPYKDIRRKGNIAHTEQCKYHSNRLN